MASLTAIGTSQVLADTEKKPPPRFSPSKRILTPRPPKGDADMRFWLQNMVVDHRYSLVEVADATGLSIETIEEAMRRLSIDPNERHHRSEGAALRMLPYPGGRHPRIGFVEGAIDPQRETKISVFTPWDPESYVVADIPEAIWSDLGLTYLAHTDIQTVWEQRGVALEPLEWARHDDSSLSLERTLPNGIRFGTRASSSREAIRMEMWLTNGTQRTLTDLRVQNCVMLKGAGGFQRQTGDNKLLSKPYIASPYEPTLDRWVITAWEPVERVWTNPPCPCIHSDPRFPDCPPGETRRLKGWLSFYEGRDIQGELKRIDRLDWKS